MRILLDTQHLLWLFIEPEKISAKNKYLLTDEENEICYSPVSLWEISIKYGIGKLKLNNATPEVLKQEIERSFLVRKELTDNELTTSYHLPKEHNDPFDLLLIWQAIQSNMAFMTSDSKAKFYKDYGLQVL